MIRRIECDRPSQRQQLLEKVARRARVTCSDIVYHQGALGKSIFDDVENRFVERIKTARVGALVGATVIRELTENSFLECGCVRQVVNLVVQGDGDPAALPQGTVQVLLLKYVEPLLNSQFETVHWPFRDLGWADRLSPDWRRKWRR